AGRAADPADGPAGAVRAVHPQLPRRTDALLAHHEPVDDRPGARPPPADAEAGAPREAKLPDAGQGRSAATACLGERLRERQGRCRSRPQARRRAAAPRQAQEGRRRGQAVTEITVEATGETVGEAKWTALRELQRRVPGLDRDAIRFQVISEGERGLLGVGYTPASVVATADVPEQPAAAESNDDETSQAGLVRELLERTVAASGVPATVRIDETGEELVATLVGPDLGVLIGRHGQTIDALQYLANAIGHRTQGEDRMRVVVEAAGDRARRAAALETPARRAAEQAAATGHRVELDPMTAIERRIVHELLKDDPEVETWSEGSEPNRFVVVLPRHSAD